MRELADSRRRPAHCAIEAPTSFSCEPHFFGGVAPVCASAHARAPQIAEDPASAGGGARTLSAGLLAEKKNVAGERDAGGRGEGGDARGNDGDKGEAEREELGEHGKGEGG